MEEARRRTRTLVLYLVFTYAALLVNMAGYLSRVDYVGAATPVFVAAVYVTYAFAYLLPLFLPLFLLNWALGRLRVPAGAAILGLAALGGGFVQLFFYTDRVLYKLYGYHFNGFVWNVLTTRGGIASMGGGRDFVIAFCLIALGFFAVQSVGLALIHRGGRLRAALDRAFSRRALAVGLVALVFGGIFERVTYGVSSIKGYTPVLAASNAFPFYIPFTFRKIGRALGIEADRKRSFRMKVDGDIEVRYPLAPIVRDPAAPRWNILWLCSESLRADVIDPEIMPATYKFARENAVWFRRHYSGGNGTRMGMFTQFYGIYGPYWFPFLAEVRGPVLIDVLQQAGYDIECYTSAGFTYPEFNKTLFAKVPSEHLHETTKGPGWKTDRENVSQMIEFFDRRDPEVPFFLFMFFESPHARYHFPPETAIKKPYLEELNYATMDLERDIGLIKNRYLNSVNHLDTQIARLLEALQARGLFDSTIVLFTGDHGEEFLEKGRWGHNNQFSEEQTRVPLILHVPGKKPEERTDMTSHLDIAPTVLGLLGVKNPPADYSLGFDLFGAARRDFTVLSDWNGICFRDDRRKAVLPLGAVGFAEQKVTTGDDGKVDDPGAFFEEYRPKLMRIMSELKRFSKQGG
jgi:membrane-anchored protein YejM (alkaline phosphatase superfamily)